MSAPDTLLLAIPRPVVLARCIEHATALGFGRIVLFRSWRVDKSHLGSKVLRPEELAERVGAGRRQAERDDSPELLTFDRFRPFVEDDLDGLVPTSNRLVAHPAAETPIHDAELRPGPFALAIGPELGFTSFEVELLGEYGFAAVGLGRYRLRVETAMATATGAIRALRERAADR